MDMNQPAGGAEQPNDKLIAAASYPIGFLVSLIILLTDMKNRPFLKYHAVQSLLFNVALYILITIVTAVTLGFGGLCAPLIWLASFYYAYLAYQGKMFEIPVLTNFMKGQGWA